MFQPYSNFIWWTLTETGHWDAQSPYILLLFFFLSLLLFSSASLCPSLRQLHLLPSSLLNPSVNNRFNCSNTLISGSQYTICSHPSLLTDSDLGPDIYTANSGNASHYLWTREDMQWMLFTFPERVLLTSMIFLLLH